MNGRRHPLIATLLCMSALLGGACSSGDEPAAGATTTTAAPGGGDSGDGATSTVVPTSESPSTTRGSAGDAELVGTWRADARDLLAANTANLGTPAMECSGPATLTFRADGTFENSGQATCSLGAMSGTGEFTSSGDYAVAGDVVTVSNAASSGQLRVGAANVPFSPALSNGSFTFDTDGSTLRLSFDGGSAGRLTQTWTRG